MRFLLVLSSLAWLLIIGPEMSQTTITLNFYTEENTFVLSFQYIELGGKMIGTQPSDSSFLTSSN